MTEQGQGERDWTAGPAKWAAVAVLLLAAGALVWWSSGRRTRVELVRAPAAEVTASPAGEVVVVRAPGQGSERPEATRTLGRVNINTATAAELELLPGIGATLAGRIVEDRAAKGRFAGVEDLLRVRGVHRGTMEGLRPLVTAD